MTDQYEVKSQSITSSLGIGKSMMFKYIRDETRSPPAILRGRQWERRGEIPPRDPIANNF